MARHDQSATTVPTSGPRTVVVALAVAAGLHLAAFPPHFEEGRGVASFFFVTALAQLAAATVVGRGVVWPGRVLIALANAGLVVLWAVSRTVGVPGAGHGGGPEPVALLDLLAVGAELVVVAGLLVRPGSPARGSMARAWPVAPLVAVVVCGAALRWTPATHGDHVHPSPSAPIQLDVPVTPVGAAGSTPSDSHSHTHTHGGHAH